ncbi:hypothetical protein ACE1CD_09265 [Aerosakkonema sp. BLCC-F183]|uniref:hypothetical protein n=1 Tax=Aerosakkonema sp. BLCC-F183 TaxID=3342834 RepID=UPI0035BA444A
MSTKDFPRNIELSGFSIPDTEKKEEKAARNCRILTIKMSNIDEQAIRAKLEQGINKNQQHIFRHKEGHLLTQVASYKISLILCT